ncbi:TetR/AcrR family transcriptional regulator [Rhodococcus sp. NPDC003318]|uniref:TetR/AcrR family transcriptional regulator n=1 Tax=Rhodococcus sp. NPDC003318 TaxID=3364503 RepID=UPI0036905469
MEPAPPDATPSGPSLLERAYLDALEQPDEDPTRARVLDAAYEQFCRMGIQRSSMEEVARRAKLSRITLYRKFDTKDALVDQVILREFRRYFTRFLHDISYAETAADRVVLGFVSSLRAIRTNPLIGGLLDTEPTLLAGSIVGSDGRMLAAVRQFVTGQLRREQQAGTISGDLNTELVAEMMVRVSASFLTIPSHIVDLDDDAQLASVARQFLVPMLGTPT